MTWATFTPTPHPFRLQRQFQSCFDHSPELLGSDGIVEGFRVWPSAGLGKGQGRRQGQNAHTETDTQAHT